MVSDYGAFRDLQRHRMLTVEWQDLGPGLGFEMPDAVADAGLAQHYESAMARSADLDDAMATPVPRAGVVRGGPGDRVRYVMHMNVREAMHVLELRSGEQGHPSYRWWPRTCTASWRSRRGTASSPRP